MPTTSQVYEALKKVKYPGFSKDIVTLGAVGGVDVTDDAIVVSMKDISADVETLDKVADEIRLAIAPLAGEYAIEVNMGAPGQPQPSGQPAESSPFLRDKLPGVNHIIPVVSGKGGVGKSTVAVNLAYTMAQLGKRVGLLDLDIFGPSVHKMTGAKGTLEVENNKILPFEKDGLKIITIGMAVPEEDALILRGPMVMKLINQLMDEVNWGELDYLIVDMPPGTGDVPLSLVQKLAVTGAVIVTTPQDIALIDVRRAVSMFRQTETNILGLVENMSHYVCEKCGDVAHIFGKGGGEEEAKKINVPLLGKIPLVKSICEEADAGNPIFSRDKSPELAKVFEELAGSVMKEADCAPDPRSAKDPFQSISTASGGG